MGKVWVTRDITDWDMIWLSFDEPKKDKYGTGHNVPKGYFTEIHKSNFKKLTKTPLPKKGSSKQMKLSLTEI